MTDEFEGHVVVVTGGARGFGKAFGAALVEHGAIVALVDLDADAAAKSAAEIGERAFAFAGDVTDHQRMDAIMSEIAGKHGGIDVLINNAGLHSTEFSRPIATLGVDKIRRMFDVNVMGTVACTLAALPHMSGRSNANILNIASSAAYLGTAYGASKMAVISLTITLARELGTQGIRVNAIAPGLILTDTIRATLEPEALARATSSQFLDMVGAEQDVVEAMLYLTSKRASFVTAETLRVTGGSAAGA